VDQMPKCFCELAGEGMKYSWAAAKNKYRKVPVTVKRQAKISKLSAFQGML
jgi:hypothetical protein